MECKLNENSRNQKEQIKEIPRIEFQQNEKKRESRKFQNSRIEVKKIHLAEEIGYLENEINQIKQFATVRLSGTKRQPELNTILRILRN